MTIGYAALAMGEDLVPYRYRLPNMTPTSVEIKVEYCGLCGSDDHLIVGVTVAVWPHASVRTRDRRHGDASRRRGDVAQVGSTRRRRMAESFVSRLRVVRERRRATVLGRRVHVLRG